MKNNAIHATRNTIPLISEDSISILDLRSSMLHIGHPLGPQALQEPARLGAIELRVVGLDTQEEAIARGMRGELRHVEDRMVRFRQAVQRQHPKYRRQRRE